MITRVRDFIAANVIAILATLLAVSAAVNVWLLVKVYGWRLGILHVEGLQAKADKADQEIKFARETAAVSENLRGQEQAQDQVSFGTTIARCDERVTTARKAAHVIEEITHAPSDQAAAGGRSIVGADQLRIIIGQAADTEAASVSVGSDGAASAGTAPAE